MTEATRQLEDHRRAQEAFAAVLGNVSPDQLDGPTPCPQWTVRELVAHVVGGNQRTASGAPPARDAAAPVAQSLGSSAGDELVGAFRQSAAAAQATFEAPDGLTRTFQVPFGEVPGSVFITLRTVDALTHGWDLAVATGQPADLDPDLAERLLAASERLLSPQLRGEGRPFAAAQPCGADRPAADRLAAFLGRSVR